MVDGIQANPQDDRTVLPLPRPSYTHHRLLKQRRQRRLVLNIYCETSAMSPSVHFPPESQTNCNLSKDYTFDYERSKPTSRK